MANAEDTGLKPGRKSRYVKPTASVVEVSPEERLMICVKIEQYKCQDWEGNPDYVGS